MVHGVKNCIGLFHIDLLATNTIAAILNVVVVVRLEHSHSFIDSFDNHSTASGPYIQYTRSFI